MKKVYVQLVNKEFHDQLTEPIDPASLNDKSQRIVKAIEEYLKANPLKTGSFRHYRPARYMSEHIDHLWSGMSKEAKDRFEKAFETLNGILK